MITIPLILFILSIIGLWFVVTKSGEEGWKVLIPFYNTYTVLKIIDRDHYFPIYMIANIVQLIAIPTVAVSFVPFLANISMSTFDWKKLADPDVLSAISGGSSIFLISVIGLIAAIIANFVIQISIYSGFCRKLGASSVMVLGLLILPGIFLMVLGFGKKYQWEQAPQVPHAQKQFAYQENIQERRPTQISQTHQRPQQAPVTRQISAMPAPASSFAGYEHPATSPRPTVPIPYAPAEKPLEAATNTVTPTQPRNHTKEVFRQRISRIEHNRTSTAYRRKQMTTSLGEADNLGKKKSE